MNTCPVCGYPELKEPPHAPSGGGSYEICPCCGFQFGVDDDDKGLSYEDARKRWVDGGCRWSSRGIAAPLKWNAEAQLQHLAKSEKPQKGRTQKGKRE